MTGLTHATFGIVILQYALGLVQGMFTGPAEDGRCGVRSHTALPGHLYVLAQSHSAWG